MDRTLENGIILSSGQMEHHFWFLIVNVWFLTYEKSDNSAPTEANTWDFGGVWCMSLHLFMFICWERSVVHEAGIKMTPTKAKGWRVQDDWECFRLLDVIMANEHEF